MKLTKTNRIAGYRSDIVLRHTDGTIIKHFSSTSGVDSTRADQNVYKNIVHFCKRAIKAIQNPPESYWVDHTVVQKINMLGLQIKDFEEIIGKISPLIIEKDISVTTTEL